MKKQLSTRGLRTSILRIACLVALFTNICFFSTYAQTGRLLTENFNYTVGNISGQGAWMKDDPSGNENTLNIIDEALTYPNYQKAKVGKSVQTRIISGQKAITPFKEQTGTIYLSALIRIDSIKDAATGDFIMAFTSGEQNASQFAKIYVKKTTEQHKFTLGVVRTGMTSYGTTSYNWGDVLLVVLKYEVVEGETNDVVSLWVNPTTSSETASNPYIQNRFGEETGADMYKQLGAVQIRQSTNAPMLTIDALRVATSWEALFDEVPVPTTPTISANPKNIDFGLGYDDLVYTKTIAVKGERLTGDISARLTSGTYTHLSKKTIDKETALSTGGEIVVQVNAPRTTGLDTLVLTSAGADSLAIPISWQCYPISELNSLAELRKQATEDADYAMKIYRIKEAALISFIYKGNTAPQYFIQTDNAGLTVNDNDEAFFESYAIGDKVENLVGQLSSTMGSISFTPMRDWDKISSNNTISPTKITAVELQQNPQMYESRLLEFSEVEFPNRTNENAGIFKEGTNPKMTQEGVSDKFFLRVLKNVDFIGDTIPAKANITGISTSGAGTVIAPRSKNDINAITPPIVVPINTPNLLSNGSFELWEATSPTFGDKPTDWEINSRTAKESTIVKEGSYALKIVEATQNYNKIEQEITSQKAQIYTDQTYQLSFSYYIVTPSSTGKDVTVVSEWANTGQSMEDDKAILANGTFFTSAVGQWATKTIQTKAPKNANGFFFNVGVGKGVVAIFDNFSFQRVPDTLIKLYVNPQTLTTLTAKVDSTVHSSKLKVDGFNLTKDISIKITGDGAQYFTPSINSIKYAIGETTGELSIAYKPTLAGRHFANVEISSPGAKTINVDIVGQASENTAGGKAVITISANMLDKFVAEVGKSMEDSIIVNANNLTDYLYAGIYGEDKGHFLISSSMFGKTVVDNKVGVTYKPRSEGSHTAYIKFYSKDADTVILTVKGTATKNTDPEIPVDLNRKISLDTTHPIALWIEEFSSIEHNKPIHDSVMQNVVPLWDRPWWGFFEKDKEGKVTERTAKATGYVYQGTDLKKCEMWLISPALDFKNAKAKIFTFRVMGDFMFENHQTKLELFYLEKEGDSSYQNKVELTIPSTPDENGDWREIHIDLTDQNIADIFFMGFRFSGLTGSENSVVYYLDDISFGRTDLATISCPSKKILLNTEVFSAVESNTIEVGGKNLKEEIAISILGPNASKFDASKGSIPTTGGNFNVRFSPLDEGLHLAYIKLSSRGAADILIPIEGRTSPATPKILVADKDLDIRLHLESGTEITSDEIMVNPFLLTANISLTLEGTNADQFRISKTMISKDGVGEKFNITYKPTQNEQKHTAKVRLHSTGASDIVINVTGDRAVAIEENMENTIRIVRTENGFLIDNGNIELKEINVYNITGQKIYYGKSVNSKVEIPIQNRGCYFIKTVNGNRVYTTKVIW